MALSWHTASRKEETAILVPLVRIPCAREAALLKRRYDLGIYTIRIKPPASDLLEPLCVLSIGINRCPLKNRWTPIW
jgi:hypothetical protein